jgi:hypothetical protein
MTPEIVTWNEPFCPYSEVRFWVDLLGRLSLLDTKNIRPDETKIEAVGVKDQPVDLNSVVVWKKLVQPTGLCLTGRYTGRLVNRYNVGVFASRFISLNGGFFNRDRALLNIKSMKLKDDTSAILSSYIQTEQDRAYPKIIAEVCDRLGYFPEPQDKQHFIDRVYGQNLTYTR